MKSAQVTIGEIREIFRRRKKLFLVPALIITVLSALGAIILKSKYESSTTILVQRDEILNPLLSFDMAIAMTSEDRLRTFNEIIRSHSTLKILLDSVYPDVLEDDDKDEQDVIQSLRAKITTDRRGADVFRISFTSPSPQRAQAGAKLLADTESHLQGTALGSLCDRVAELAGHPGNPMYEMACFSHINDTMNFLKIRTFVASVT